MAKNTHSQERLTGTSDSYDERELTDPLTMLRNRPVLGEVDKPRVQVHETQDREPEVVTLDEGGAPSVGSNSLASSESESTESEPETPVSRQHAPTMENPSNQEAEQSDTARTADGSTPEMEPQPSGKAPRKAAQPRKSTTARKPPTAADDDF